MRENRELLNEASSMAEGVEMWRCGKTGKSLTEVAELGVTRVGGLRGRRSEEQGSKSFEIEEREGQVESYESGRRRNCEFIFESERFKVLLNFSSASSSFLSHDFHGLNSYHSMLRNHHLPSHQDLSRAVPSLRRSSNSPRSYNPRNSPTI